MAKNELFFNIMSQFSKDVKRDSNIINVRKVKTREGNISLPYLSWSQVHAALSVIDPAYNIKWGTTGTGEEVFVDQDTGYVKGTITVHDMTRTEIMPILSGNNQAIQLNELTASDIENAKQRLTVKLAGLVGYGLSLWNNKDTTGRRWPRINLAKELGVKSIYTFADLQRVNWSAALSKKGNFPYLSWVNATYFAEQIDANWQVEYAEYDSTYLNAKTGELLPTKTHIKPTINGQYGTVSVTVTINGIPKTVEMVVVGRTEDSKRDVDLPIDQITSFDTNRALHRGIAKAVALHGVAFGIYGKGSSIDLDSGYDVPAEAQQPDTANLVHISQKSAQANSREGVA